MPKITLEFDDEESEDAQHAIDGPGLYGAAMDVRSWLRAQLEHVDMDDATRAKLTEVQREFSEAFGDYLR